MCVCIAAAARVCLPCSADLSRPTDACVLCSGWAAEEAKRPRKLGGEGTRAPARATVGGAASVKLARQEGVEVDRMKEADADMKTVRGLYRKRAPPPPWRPTAS